MVVYLLSLPYIGVLMKRSSGSGIWLIWLGMSAMCEWKWICMYNTVTMMYKIIKKINQPVRTCLCALWESNPSVPILISRLLYFWKYAALHSTYHSIYRKSWRQVISVIVLWNYKINKAQTGQCAAITNHKLNPTATSWLDVNSGRIQWRLQILNDRKLSQEHPETELKACVNKMIWGVIVFYGVISLIHILSPCGLATCAPFYQHGLTLIPAWISNYTHYIV